MPKCFKNNLVEERLKSNPLVSIAVITYNSSKFVVETLESAKDQSYNNIELIISDDGSSDETVAICQRWIMKNKDRFTRTKIITIDKNTGIPANLNRGIKACKGEWIKGIAGDDALLSTCIFDNLLFAMQHKGINLLFSYSKSYHDEFNKEKYICDVPLKEPLHFFNDIITPQQQYKMLLIKDRIAAAATSFIKREIFDQYKLDERFKLIDDYPFWLKITKAGYKLHFMPTPTIMHRSHSDSVHNSTNKDLINPSYFRNENLRAEYVYPNISWKYRMGFHYKLLVSSLLVKVFHNRLHPISKAFKIIFLNYLNPLVWLEKTDRSIK